MLKHLIWSGVLNILLSVKILKLRPIILNDSLMNENQQIKIRVESEFTVSQQSYHVTELDKP